MGLFGLTAHAHSDTILLGADSYTPYLFGTSFAKLTVS